ncbi:MAG: L-histidine N(alpha)-methyltransferase [Candidatus Micrarchaeia archaeon]|jgi:uncharacterized SAM-dependent methyltransferase
MLTKSQQTQIAVSSRKDELPYKFSYTGEGAAIWNDYSEHSLLCGASKLEQQLLEKRLDAVFVPFGNAKRINIVDIGCGNGKPILPVIAKAKQLGLKVRYVAVDLSREMLDLSSQNVRNAFPDIDIECRQLDFETELFVDAVRGLGIGDEGNPGLFVFLGTTLGNFSDETMILKNFRDAMGPQDYLLIGVERTKPANMGCVVERYSQEGNLKRLILSLPRRLGFDDTALDYHVDWNHKEQRVEFKLIPKRDLEARIGDETVLLAKSKPLLTLRSKKFDEQSLAKLFCDTGFRNELMTTNHDVSYILSLVQPAQPGGDLEKQ